MSKLVLNVISLLLCNYFSLISGDKTCIETPQNKPAHLRLKEDLTCDYDITIRPVINKNGTGIDIKMLIHNLEYSQYGNDLDVKCWFIMKWKDEHIFWDPESYDHIEEFFVSSDDIWTPDVSVFNSPPNGDVRVLQDKSQCLIFHDNKVICIATTTLSSLCIADYTYWPFDSQNCTMNIGSWFHKGEEIYFSDVEMMKYFAMYEDNPDWELINYRVVKNPGILKCCPNDTYPYLTFVFEIKRHISTKIFSVILPYIALNAITLLSGWLDPTSSERIYITVVNIPCHIMFLLSSGWEIPIPGDTVPHFLLLLRNSLLLSTIILLETLIVRWLLNNTKESPSWLVKFFSLLVNNKTGQLILFSELNPEYAASLSADDSTNLVEIQERPKEWYLLGRITDRLFFFIYILTYFFMYLTCIPK